MKAHGLVLGALYAVIVMTTPAGAGHPRFGNTRTIDAQAAHQLMIRGGDVVAVDLRPREEFRQGRLPRARSVPLPSLVRRWTELPREAVIVLYGQTDEGGLAAHQFLWARQYTRVFVLAGGFAAWHEHGYGVER